MDFTKFVSLLESSALHFARADQFDDLFEGSVPDEFARPGTGIAKRYLPDAEAIAERALKNWEATARTTVFVNCWHANPDESDAMWKVFGSSRQAVAVQPTVGSLTRCLPPTIHVAIVHYIRYDKFRTPPALRRLSDRIDNRIIWCTHKRREYRHRGTCVRFASRMTRSLRR